MFVFEQPGNGGDLPDTKHRGHLLWMQSLFFSRENVERYLLKTY